MQKKKEEIYRYKKDSENARWFSEKSNEFNSFLVAFELGSWVIEHKTSSMKERQLQKIKSILLAFLLKKRTCLLASLFFS